MRDLDMPVSQAGNSQNYKKARDCYEKGSYDEAIALFNEELEKNPDKNAYYELAQVYDAKEDVVKAIQTLLEAVKIDKTYHEAFAFLGDCYVTKRQGMPAIESYAHAVSIQPMNEEYKQKLINSTSVFQFKKTNPNLKGVLIECLESDNVDIQFFGNTWLSIITRDASVGPYYKLSKCKNYESFKKEIQSFPNCDGLIEPFFLTGLGKFTVIEYKFELWVGFLRRYLLESIMENKSLFSDPEDIDLITCAISRYCFYTDYIMDFSDEEVDLTEKLEKKILSSDKPKLSELACLGCYKHIYTLDNAQEIAKNLQGGDHVSQIPKAQIEDYLEQQEIIKGIETITSIDDEVSSAVREQYEEFPYPRWAVAAKNLFNVEIEGHLKGKKIKILNAGCGTGKESIQMAYVFPDAEITAVDLSKTSLAYGIFKARQLGIENITFKQADIMELGSLDERFDYIASAGVLHHMKDPVAGWKILCGLLKPKGLMRIALYSRIARWGINDARDDIKNKNIGHDSNSIREYRKNIKSHIKHKSIKNIQTFHDYFALPECRDLLFHVQEHQYDLLEIKNILDELGLEFTQFYMSEANIEKYKKQNKHDEAATDLVSWAKWEEKNPNLFASMYTFWCRKI